MDDNTTESSGAHSSESKQQDHRRIHRQEDLIEFLSDRPSGGLGNRHVLAVPLIEVKSITGDVKIKNTTTTSPTNFC